MAELVSVSTTTNSANSNSIVSKDGRIGRFGDRAFAYFQKRTAHK